MALSIKECRVVLTYNSISVTVSTIWIIHRRNVNFAFVDEPVLQVNQAESVSDENEVKVAYIYYHANRTKIINR